MVIIIIIIIIEDIAVAAGGLVGGFKVGSGWMPFVLPCWALASQLAQHKSQLTLLSLSVLCP